MAAFPIEQLIFRSRTQVQTQAKAQAAPREGVLEAGATYCAAFLGSCLVGGLAFGLIGQLLLQRTWLDADGAKARMASSQSAVKDAREVLRNAEATKAVERWASAQGFSSPALLPSSGFAAPRTEVATSPLEGSHREIYALRR